MFSIKNVDQSNSSTYQIKSDKKAHAIYSNPANGPCFGTKDLVIGDKPNKEGSCSSELGFEYDKSKLGEDEAKTILAGSSKFGLTQMEVFYMGN